MWIETTKGVIELRTHTVVNDLQQAWNHNGIVKRTMAPSVPVASSSVTTGSGGGEVDIWSTRAEMRCAFLVDFFNPVVKTFQTVFIRSYPWLFLFTLSQYLFSLYTNDCISSCPTITVVKFADDTTVLGLVHPNPSNKHLRECSPSSCSARWMSPPGSAPISKGSQLKVSSPLPSLWYHASSAHTKEDCIVQTSSRLTGSGRGKTQAEG